MNRSVNLTKRITTPDGLRFCPVVRSANGRIKANAVLVEEREEQHPEGSYYIEWYDGDKRLRRSVGKNALAAEAKRHQQEQLLTAKADGLKAGLKFAEETNQPSLAAAVTTYLAEIQLTKKPKTLAAYTKALDYFMESCKKQNVADIERRDMLEFAAYLRDEKEQAPRSVYNKFENVMTFLKANGIRGIVGKNDWPRYTEEEPEIYEPEELEKLFKACDGEERLWFEFFLMTGEREQEVMYTYRSDVNCAGHVVRVTHKPDRGWTPKAYKEREIPIPAKLADRLKTWMAKAGKKCNLLFPTAGCNPKLDFLDRLKACAERAKLDKDDFWLHKFRATFATRCLWAGVDLRTVKEWLGHEDMESTMRYLKPSRSQEVRAKVNEIFA
ncbi:MAG: site-specific integrase [Candidatus Sulfotelmatobacter sp.]